MARVWFVTGASSGLGRAIAEAAVARGDLVAATAREPRRLDDLVASAPDRVRAIRLDVACASEVQPAVEACTKAFGGVNVLVNNAGVGLLGALEEVTSEQIRRCIETNLMGPIRLMRAVLPIMREKRSGLIINISAAAAIANYSGFSIYGGAKAALESVGEGVAMECAPFGVKVCNVQPGPFRTEFIARSLDKAPGTIGEYDATRGRFAALLKGMDGKQPGDPAKAATIIVSLADEENPPLRLALGKYAIAKVRKRAAASLGEVEAWEARAGATDHGPTRAMMPA